MSRGFINFTPTKEFIIDMIRSRGVQSVYPTGPLSTLPVERVVDIIEKTPDSKWYGEDKKD